MSSTRIQKTLFSDKLLLAYLALLLWLPVSIASNRPLAWALAQTVAAIVTLAWLIQYLRARRQIPETCRRAWPFLTLLAAWCLWVALQLVPLPPSLVEWLSPQAAWVHSLTFHPGISGHWITLSVDPHSTSLSLQKSVGYFLTSLLALLLANGHKQITWLAGALVMAGLIQVGIGFFGLQQHSSLYAAEVNASFANRNHLANYLTLCIAAGLGLLLAKMDNSTPGDWRGSLRHAIDWLMSGKMRLRFSLLLMAITIVLTRSRMGNVAFFSSMLIAGVLTLALTRQRRRGLVILVSSIVAIDIVVIGSMVGIERVAQRLEDTSLVAETRDEVARDTIEYWRDFPLTGSGLGSFSVTFPRYKHGDVSLFYKRAHNDYLQFAAETGVIGVLLLGCMILLSIGIAIRTLHRRHDPLALGISFAVVMSGAAVLIHATVEFNLQTYANAATFCVVLAMGWVAANLPRRRGTDAAIATPPPRKRLTAAAALLALVVYVAWTLSTAGADLINRSNTQFLAGWTDKGVAKADTVRAVMRRQIDAIHLAPHDAQAKILLARLAWWQLRVSEDRPDSEKVYDQMLYALLDATRDNPGLGSVWASVATVRHFQRHYDGLFEAALSNTNQLTPWEPHIQQAITRIGLGAWENLATPTQRQIVIDTIARGLRSNATAIKHLLKQSGRAQEICKLLDDPDSTACDPES